MIPKGSINIINMLSIISFVGIIVSIMILVIILSAFNGMSDMIKTGYKNLQPDLLVKSRKGHFFNLTDTIKSDLDNLRPKLSYYEILESKAMLSYNNFSSVATIKGVTKDYLEASKLDTLLTGGSIILKDEAGFNYGLLSDSLARYLRVNIDAITYIVAKAPDKNFNKNNFFHAKVFSQLSIKPIATFISSDNSGSNDMFTHIDFARKLFGYEHQISSVEIFLKSNVLPNQVKKQLINIFGHNYNIKTKDEQNESIYKILNTEKLTIYIILSFVMFIAICNMVGSLTMLIVSKRKDIAVLMAIGYPLNSIRRIFFVSGNLLVFLGSIVGLILGLIICILQQKFKLVMIATSGVMKHEPYPILINVLDIFIIFFIAIILSIPALLLTSKIGTKNIHICKELKP
ncbi:MAG: ABC transporter permease [Solitalea-like symbiont of Acarus siro]